MTRKSTRPLVDAIELEGPSGPTLTPPPERRFGPAVLVTVTLVALVAVGSALIVRPELVSVVQAFVGEF